VRRRLACTLWITAIVVKRIVITSKFHCEMKLNDDLVFWDSMIITIV